MFGENEVTQGGENWYISYSAAPIGGRGEETALVVKRDGTDEDTPPWKEHDYFILDGDFREDYKDLIPDLDACKKFFTDNSDKKSEWSN